MIDINAKLKRPKTKGKRRYKLKKGIRNKLLILGAVSIVVIIAAIVFYSPASEEKMEEMITPTVIGTIRVDNYKDLNKVHLKYAKANGIKGFKSDKEFRENIKEYVNEGDLAKIENSDYYVVDDLTHSHPYLTPEAAKLLDDIGKRFQKKLDENNLKKSYFQVTSLLRTGESQRRLGRSNTNASSNSSHLYGTTFDITYARVFRKPRLSKDVEVADGPAIKLLSEVIGELRKEKRCVVVTERNERCFHITVK
jgi:uncharacterized protein YcbK (DUF882 family)